MDCLFYRLMSVVLSTIILQVYFCENIRAESIAVEQVSCGEPFSYTIEPYESHAQYEVKKLSWPTPFPDTASEDKTVLGYLYLPKDEQSDQSPRTGSPRTGIVCLDGLGGNGAITGLLAAYFSASGFPVLLPVAPYTSDRAERYGNVFQLSKRPESVVLITKALNQMHDEVRRGIDLFVARPEVRDDKVQIIGASLGAIFTAGLVAKDKRIDRAILLVGGGSLMKIVEADAARWPELMATMKNSTPEVQEELAKAVANIEPMNYTAALAAKAEAGKLRMLNAEKDEIIPPVFSRELAVAAGMADKQVIFPNVGHFSALGFLPRLLPDFANWFADESIPLRVPVPEHTPEDDRIASVCSSLLTLIDTNADAKKSVTCHFNIAKNRNNETTPVAQITFARKGSEFTVEFIPNPDAAPLPGGIKQMAFGQSEFPWVALSDAIQTGSQRPDSRPLAEYIKPELVTAHQIAAGILLLGNSPEAIKALRSLLGIQLEASDSNSHQVEARGHGLKLVFELSPSNESLKQIFIEREESNERICIEITSWQESERDAAWHLPFPTGETHQAENSEIKAVIALLINQGFEQLLANYGSSQK